MSVVLFSICKVVKIGQYVKIRLDVAAIVQNCLTPAVWCAFISPNLPYLVVFRFSTHLKCRSDCPITHKVQSSENSLSQTGILAGIVEWISRSRRSAYVTMTIYHSTPFFNLRHQLSGTNLSSVRMVVQDPMLWIPYSLCSIHVCIGIRDTL